MELGSMLDSKFMVRMLTNITPRRSRWVWGALDTWSHWMFLQNKIEIKMSRLKWHIKGKIPYCSLRECDTYVSVTWIDKEEKQSKFFRLLHKAHRCFLPILWNGKECNIVLVGRKALRSMESSQQSWKWEAVTAGRTAELGVKWGNSSCWQHFQ